MFLSEQQVTHLVSEFMPRIRKSSIPALIDVACNGMSILASSQKYGITHQSLSKNLLKLKETQRKIKEVPGLLPASYLFNENAHALHMSNAPYEQSKEILSEFCTALGGKVNIINSEKVNFYLENTVTCIFLNPDESYDREWHYDHNEVI